MCVAPRIIYYIIVYFGDFEEFDNDNEYMNYLLSFIYWLHYAANFVIYAARSDQYRQAYIYFINEVLDTYTYQFYKSFYKK